MDITEQPLFPGDNVRVLVDTTPGQRKTVLEPEGRVSVVAAVSEQGSVKLQDGRTFGDASVLMPAFDLVKEDVAAFTAEQRATARAVVLACFQANISDGKEEEHFGPIIDFAVGLAGDSEFAAAPLVPTLRTRLTEALDLVIQDMINVRNDVLGFGAATYNRGPLKT